MLWFKGKADGDKRDVLRPAQLRVTLDESIFRLKLQQLLGGINEKSHLDEYLTALANKSQLFAKTFAEEQLESLSPQGLDALLEYVFTARRKLHMGLQHLPHEAFVAQLKALLYGVGPLSQRLDDFVALMDNADKKVRRAAWDFAAEVLHFSAPDRYPLMTRWVWDENAQSGSLREFIRGNDSLPRIDIGQQAEEFEAARVWFKECLSEQGFYRDIPFLIDMVQAQAYTDYMLAMSSGMGMMNNEFGGRMEPVEFVAKLLGIDSGRRNGRSKVKHTSLH